jgi:16S rRNA (adenine1518-N6/adenine1519-N6)-dimethyltransferase
VGSPPGGEAYGALSVGVQAVASAERLFTVPAGAFHPRPKVDSAVLRLTPLAEPVVRDAEVDPFRRLVVGLFGFRRKQMGRGLRELTGWGVDRVERALARAAIDPRARPETVAPAQFAALLRTLVDGGWTAR